MPKRVRPFKVRWSDIDQYDRVDEVPPDIAWRPMIGRKSDRATTLCSIGDYYRLVRIRATGEVTYYKRREDDAPAKSPAEVIDAEPVPLKQQRFPTGCRCWFIDTGGWWYLVEVVERTGQDRETRGEPTRITIKSVTGWDADRHRAWLYGELLEFPASPANPLFQRLRKLSARQP